MLVLVVLCVIPVSYTHLDVYKRQLLHVLKWSQIILVMNSIHDMFKKQQPHFFPEKYLSENNSSTYCTRMTVCNLIVFQLSSSRAMSASVTDACCIFILYTQTEYAEQHYCIKTAKNLMKSKVKQLIKFFETFGNDAMLRALKEV